MTSGDNPQDMFAAEEAVLDRLLDGFQALSLDESKNDGDTQDPHFIGTVDEVPDAPPSSKAPPKNGNSSPQSKNTNHARTSQAKYQLPSYRTPASSIAFLGYRRFKARPTPKTTRSPSALVKDIPPHSSVRMKQHAAPALHTATRARERQEKAEHFFHHAERVMREKHQQRELYKRRKHVDEIKRSMRPAMISVPDEPLLFSGQRWYEDQQEKLEEKRLAEEEKRKQMTESFRARPYNPSPPKVQNVTPKRSVTVTDPFVLRSTARHDAYQARLTQQIREEKEREEAKKKQPSFQPRPVPKTTYKYKPISTFQDSPESVERFERLRQQKIEERKRLEQEHKFASRPVPKTTYESKVVAATARVEESLRRITDLQQKRLDEQKRKEEEKEKQRAREAKYRYKPRPVPSTTYTPKPVSPKLYTKALSRAEMVRQQKLEEQKRKEEQKLKEEEEAKVQFKPRPVPPTTYSHKPVSPRETKSMSNAVLVREQRLEKVSKKLEGTEQQEDKFSPRPVPKSTYEFTPSPRFEDSLRHINHVRQQKMDEIRKKGYDQKDDEHEFHARPLPKSTYEPPAISPQRIRKSPEKASPKKKTPSIASETPIREYHSETKHASGPSFRARPVPKSLYRPSISPGRKSASAMRKPSPTKKTAQSPQKAATKPAPEESVSIPPPEAAEAQDAPISQEANQAPEPQASPKPQPSPKPFPSVPQTKKVTTPSSASSFRARAVPKSLYQTSGSSSASPKRKQPVRSVAQPKSTTPKSQSIRSTAPRSQPTKSTSTPRSQPTKSTKPRSQPTKLTASKTKPKSTSSQSSGSVSSASFRARPVPKTTYQSPQRSPTTGFRPIAKPKKSPHTSNSTSHQESPQFHARPAPQSSTFNHAPMAAAKSSAVVAQSTTSSFRSTTEPAAEDGPPATTAAMNGGEKTAGDVDDHDLELEAILNDVESPEITFVRESEDFDDDPDPEVAAILGGVDPWTATSEDDDDDDDYEPQQQLQPDDDHDLDALLDD